MATLKDPPTEMSLNPSPRHHRKLMAAAIIMGVVGLAMSMFIPLLIFGLALFGLGVVLGIFAYFIGKASDVAHGSPPPRRMVPR
jgi:disulfide bond formation protein DsbB